MRKSTYQLAFVVATLAVLGTAMPLRASETDDRVEASFQKTYVYNTYLKDDAIKTEAKDGVVTLTGTVAEESHKSLAQETVAGLAGVTRVDNQLVTTGERAVENSDAWVGAKVKTAPLVDRNESASGTKVDVKDGVVTLNGEAASEAQEELTAEYAKDPEDVKDVKNEMTVVKTPEMPERTEGKKIDDASITAQVKMPLPSHRPAAPTGLRMVSSP